MAKLLAACLALAAFSLLLPSEPSYDPFSWLVWGREIAHGHRAADDDLGGSLRILFNHHIAVLFHFIPLFPGYNLAALAASVSGSTWADATAGR